MMLQFMGNLTVEKVNNIAAGLFGIYYRPETEGYVRDNVKRVFPVIWEIISEDTKNEFGIKRCCSGCCFVNIFLIRPEKCRSNPLRKLGGFCSLLF